MSTNEPPADDRSAGLRHFELHAEEATARVTAALDAASGLPVASSTSAAEAELDRWEAEHSEHLPLRALHEALGFGRHALRLLFAVGLFAEDEAFAALDELMRGERRDAAVAWALLARCWPAAAPDLRDVVQHLVDLGLCRATA